MRKNHLSVHSENILPIIKKWLYSDKEIFIRELVSNASDALNKVRILRDQENLQSSTEEEGLKISLTLDKKNKTLTIADTGIGMTEEEVEKYIAQIAFSGAEEFAKKFKTQTEKDPIIGHFGLGFYSAYMVAARVDIDTLSYQPNSEPVLWSCDGSSDYSIGKGARSLQGTEITLHIDDESLEYLEEPKLRELLHRYCSFMPFPIELNGKLIAKQEPLWLKNPTDCTEKEYLSFYRHLFPTDPEPIFWIHLNVDYPFHLKGILYFPKIHRRFEPTDNSIKLFCNRVFVSSHCKDILPEHLTVLRGVLDSPDIPLNVSRSYLQVDKNVRQLSSHISKKISDRLIQVYKTDREKFISLWPDVEMVVKLGLLQDEKFYDRIQEILIWKNSEGNWTTLAEYMERAKEKKVFYSPSDQKSPILELYQQKKIEILFTPASIDTAVIQFLEDKLSITFQRVDGSLDPALLDPSREKTLLDPEGRSEGAKLADFIRSALEKKEVEVEAKSLASDQMAALVILDENQRRLRDYISLTQGKSNPDLVGKKTFVVNTNNKLIQAIYQLQQKHSDVAVAMTKGLYDLSLLAQREMEPGDLEKTVQGQTEIMEKLVSLLGVYRT